MTTSHSKIPEAAVEAAEAVLLGYTGGCACHEGYSGRNLIDPGCSYHDVPPEVARLILEAAAPHMLREAWNEFMKGKWDPDARKPLRDRQVIPEAALEAAGQALREAFDWGVADFDKQAQRALEAAAPHMLEGVTALADAWEARGEHDMKVAKTIKDEYIASEILGHGAQMVENARHIRNAIGKP